MTKNMVKKPKKIETFDADDDDVVEESSSRGSSDDAKQKLFKMMGIICGVMVGLLVIIYIASLLSQKEYTYADIENIMKEAAVGYFNDNPRSNMMISALAGSGKSTMACLLSEHTTTSDIYVAFNNSIAEEFRTKIKTRKR